MGKGSQDKGVIKRWLYFTDPHIPYHDQPAFNCTMKAIEIIKPDGVGLLGDIFENDFASHWQWKRRQKPPLEFQLEKIDEGLINNNYWMDVIDEVLDRAKVASRIYCEGNHEEWLDIFVESHPHLSKTAHKFGSGYEFHNTVNLAKRGYKYFRIGEKHKNGRLYLYHGHLHGGIHHSKAHLIKMGVNVMYGH
ncbi:unnamed protein product, partial [marine sediment metagenome]